MQVDINKIRGLIGRRVVSNGVECTIIEVLDDLPALVLQASDTVIQPDQHGEAHRRVPTTFTVPVLNASGNEYSPAYLNLHFLDG